MRVVKRVRIVEKVRGERKEKRKDEKRLEVKRTSEKR